MKKEEIRNVIELFIAWNGETDAIDVANIDSAVDFVADLLQENNWKNTGGFGSAWDPDSSDYCPD